jgi:hypothetical protein
MLRADRTATPPSTATAVVTVDPVGDEHRALFPALPTQRTSSPSAATAHSSIVELFATTAGIPALRMRAQQYAAHWGHAYFEPCTWCGINCTPTDRLDHERLSRGNETTWRAAA